MPKKKNPHAQALGKLGAKARWAGTTQKERTVHAQKAGRARWQGLSKEERSRIAALGGKASKGVHKSGRRKDRKP